MKIIALLCALTVNAYAAVLTYSFEGSAGNEANFAVDTQPENALASDFSRGSGIGASSGAGTFSANNWTTDATLDANDYFSFTLTPNNGFSATLESIVLDERRSGTGPREWSVRSSLDIFGSDVITVAVPDNTSTRTDQVIALDGSYAGITEAIEFRFYGYLAESGSGTWRLDNVMLNGSITAVPEPSFYAALAGGACICVVIRRKR